MSLTLSAQPGFTEVPDTTFAAGNAASSSALTAVNDDTKFAAVRNEQFYGYYRNGETVVLPTSPADGYAYTMAELRFSPSWYWTGSATGPCNGTQTPPPRGVTSGAGQILQMGADVNQTTGLVSTQVSYYKTAEQDTNDGILMVVTHAQRNR